MLLPAMIAHALALGVLSANCRDSNVPPLVAAYACDLTLSAPLQQVKHLWCWRDLTLALGLGIWFVDP